ncbi:hypothetical protein [Xenorhabdus bovienii]|uniref:hypothetical protein n=1 Tax=Xenorhabdus bovienii TaxID=40576 RepID=UPI0023B34BD8|nr:hypothetical protein [Xenorhabdus bovienii]MDE9454588.1 hypothetical protein [Xenorhabdus bovienii]MDE9494500.1 hypothetical protein [Xenorhabdus bovienii]MDE9502897.1 hypothetical protein [Xenorhabdus bovienii]MDE9526547.1 hypothetical protein [Xenorhabdus bovienii]MDE9568855.1 hypothetical protein [Xenorhabdus bovienii]
MKNKVILLSILSVSALLVGCSSTRLDASASKEVPIERMHWESGRDDDGTKSVVIVKRDRGFVGSGCYQHIHINGMKVAELGIGEKVTLYVPPRDYILNAYLGGGGLCASLAGSLTAKILPNSSNVFRVITNWGSAPKIIRDNDFSMEINNSVFQ